MRLFKSAITTVPLVFFCLIQAACPQNVAPWESPRRLSEDQRKSALVELLEWSRASHYEFGLVNLFGKVDFSGRRNPFNLSTTREYWLTPETPPQFDKKFQDQNNAFCVKVRGLGTDAGQLLPLPAAQFFADSFAAGFVCRMMLSHAMESQAIGPVNLNLKVETLLNSDQLTKIQRYVKVDEYKYKKAVGNTRERKVSPEMFSTNLASLLRQESITAYGLLWGWRAASELDAIKQTNPNYWESACTLVGSRYSPEQLGSMTSFALTYIAGFSAAANKPPSRGGDNPQDSLQAISGDGKESLPEAVMLTRNLFQAFHIEYSRLLKANELHLEDNEHSLISRARTDNLINAYGQFLLGLQTGASTAAYLIFKEAYAMGYNMGYQDGFRDGYTAGYAAGSKDGFARGQKAANDELLKKLKDLGDKLAIVDTVAGGGLVGKLGEAEGVVKKVVKVGKTVAKLFGF